MVYVVKKLGPGRYVVRNRYTTERAGRECRSHGEAQSRADRLNKTGRRDAHLQLRAMAAGES